MTITWESRLSEEVPSHINVIPSHIRNSDCISCFCKIPDISIKRLIDSTATASVWKNIGPFDNINLTFNSAENFLSLIPVFDWLMSYCGNSILHH